MNHDCLKLTTYFAERDRGARGFLADELLDLYARHEFQGSALLRGAEGFGSRHRLQTQRVLTLSEDLPVVTVAVDARERIQAALPEVLAATRHGLVTLERARMLVGHIGEVRLPEELHEATKLTISVGRRQRIDGTPAHMAIVDVLQRHGVSGATVLLGVDGTVHGVRQRARLFGRNADVPILIISVGTGDSIASALPELGTLMAQPLMTLERVRVCKRDGRRLATPRELPETDASGLPMWEKLMIYTSEQAKHDGHPLHVALIRRLREEGASGATALRGIWGFHGDHRPHGDRFWALARHVPVVTVVVDTPPNARRWFEVVDELTQETGLVTSEMVPAARARPTEDGRGELRLATQDR